MNKIKIDKSKWSKVSFDDIAIQEKEEVDRDDTTLNKYVKGEHMGSEDLHIREWGELKDEYLGPAFIRKFEKGDILYGSRRTYLKKVAVAHFDGITANTTFVIKPNEKVIHKDLLPFLMLSDGFTEHSIKNSKGSVNPYINWKDIGNYEFLLPPKEEQTKLAKLLWAADNVVEKDKALLEKLEVVKSIYFLDIIKREQGNEIPLSEILILKKDRSQPPHKINKYIGLENINSGEFQCLSYSESKEVKAICNLISSGDICYSKLRPYLDKAFIASFEAVCTTELLVFDVIPGIRKEYILYYLHSMPFIKYASENGFGTKMPRINEEIIGKYHIKYLSEKKQNDLLGELASVEKSHLLLKSKLQSSQALLKALINEIFGG